MGQTLVDMAVRTNNGHELCSKDAYDWLLELPHDDPQRAWDECNNGAWMFALIEVTATTEDAWGKHIRKKLLLCAYECAMAAVQKHRDNIPEIGRLMDATGLQLSLRGTYNVEELNPLRDALGEAGPPNTEDSPNDVMCAVECANLMAGMLEYHFSMEELVEYVDAANRAEGDPVNSFDGYAKCAQIIRMHYPKYPMLSPA